MGPNKENFEATRKTILKVAREEFSENGYIKASTARIVQESGVARGTLYYHFGDKRGLFRVLYEQVLKEILAAVQEEIKAHEDPWEGFEGGCKAYIECCRRKDVLRIALIESRLALTYQDRMHIQSYTLGGALRHLLTGLMEKGLIPKQDLYSLSAILFGALSESGRALELAPDPESKKEEMVETMLWLLRSMRSERKEK